VYVQGTQSFLHTQVKRKDGSKETRLRDENTFLRIGKVVAGCRG
jgi:hypothetical protein